MASARGRASRHLANADLVREDTQLALRALPLEVSDVRQGLLTALAILPLPIGMITVSRKNVAITSRIAANSSVTAVMILVGAGLTALSFVTLTIPYIPYGLALLAVSTGMGLSVPNLSGRIIASLPATPAETGSGLNSAAREIGAALGVAIIGTVVTGQFNPNRTTHPGVHTESISRQSRRHDDSGQPPTHKP